MEHLIQLYISHAHFRDSIWWDFFDETRFAPHMFHNRGQYVSKWCKMRKSYDLYSRKMGATLEHLGKQERLPHFKFFSSFGNAVDLATDRLGCFIRQTTIEYCEAVLMTYLVEIPYVAPKKAKKVKKAKKAKKGQNGQLNYRKAGNVRKVSISR